MRRSESQRRGGFTLLEVIIALMILGLAFASLFTSQIQAGHAGSVARHTATASMLARCKMGEIEEQVLREGLPAVNDEGEDECCEGAELEGYTCEWNIERVVLPDDFGDDDPLDPEGGEGEGGLGDALGASGGGGDPLGGLGGLIGDEGAQTSALDSALGGGLGGGGGIAEMAISIAYPVLKPSIEEQVRRATVHVSWQEGARRVGFDVVQYLVAEQPPAPEEVEDGT